ncbi:hypothetical protein [Marinobacter zhanjiangensis]|uniref:DUF4476 domain-containing protein n=1 Tax=Marinobacter zhanjiangensis TaxID=578215 RepID=A0ABQ3AXA8_9GAMM|nr:hypothetical protein [Marinobacter zhanjiangensis]GGY69740.1 hypothetical protein GCM10007071_15800 [Marinobacter zhanjiangensis]
MARILATAFTSIALALLSLSTPALELGDNPLALVGDNGLEAIVAPTADNSQALIKLTGLNHPLDGVVMLAEVEQRDNDGRAYRAEVDGKQRSLVVYAQSYWSPTDYTAYIPGQQEPHAIKADEERSAAINVDELVAEYEQQMGEGRQAGLARFDRAKAVQRQQAALADIDDSASKVCGSPVSTSVDWEALTNDQLNNLNITGYCGQVAAEMEYLCLSDASFKQQVKEISEVSCGFADALNLSRHDQSLVFQTSEDASNQRETINDFLQTL